MAGLTAYQIKTLTAIRNLGGEYVGFANDPTIKRLIAKGLITFSPTGFGAGYVQLTPLGAAIQSEKRDP